MYKPRNIYEYLLKAVIVRNKTLRELQDRNEYLEDKVRLALCKECNNGLIFPRKTIRCHKCKYGYCPHHFNEWMVRILDIWFCRLCVSVVCNMCNKSGGVFKCRCDRIMCSDCGKIYIQGHIAGCSCVIDELIVEAFCSNACMTQANFKMNPKCVGISAPTIPDDSYDESLE